MIVKLDGREIDRSADLPSRVATLKPGSTTHLEVWRGGKPIDIAVSLGELKDTTTVAKADTPDKPRTPRRRGPAAASGGSASTRRRGRQRRRWSSSRRAARRPRPASRRGDVILSFNGEPVQSAEQLKALLAKAGGNAAVLLQRGRNRIFVPVELG